MKFIKKYLPLISCLLYAQLVQASQEIAEQLNRARNLQSDKTQQLHIILAILKPSSGATAEQRQEAESFPVFQDRFAYWSGR